MMLCIVAIHNVFAQNIKRKGSLGVSFYQNVPDTLAKRLNYQSGAIVQVAVPIQPPTNSVFRKTISLPN